MLQSTVSQSRSSYNSETIASKHKYISDSQLTECKPFSGKNEVKLREPTDPIIIATGELACIKRVRRIKALYNLN